MNNCNDCDNKTDGICCHQTIRNATEVVGNPHSIKRNVLHTEMMQEQRAQKYLFDSMNTRTESKHQPLYGVLVDLGGE